MVVQKSKPVQFHQTMTPNKITEYLMLINNVAHLTDEIFSWQECG